MRGNEDLLQTTAALERPKNNNLQKPEFFLENKKEKTLCSFDIRTTDLIQTSQIGYFF